MKRRGAFLISVLLLSLLITMFVGAAISLAPGGLLRANQDSRLQSADRAAKSGLAWAQSRLRTSPDWLAKTPVNFNLTIALIQEKDGQVVGWTREGPTWNRFRIRFNWQDGPASNSPTSDDLNDPAQNWPDFILLSCNNLAGGTSKMIPIASGAGGGVPSSPSPRLTVPAGSALLSIEGASGSVTYDATGNPSGFSGSPQIKTLEVVLHLSGNGQGVIPAALMAAGDVKVLLASASSSKLNLTASGTQATRLRTKGNLKVSQGGSPNVLSSQGDLRANSLVNITNNGTSGSVSATVEGSTDPFYSIPSSDVKSPATPITPPAGVYVVNNAGVMTYYDMDYAAYNAAKAAGTLTGGSTVTLPGVSVGSSGTSPKVRLTVSQDVLVSPTSNASDFVVIPDGGAPTTNTTYSAPVATGSAQSMLALNAMFLSGGNTASALSGWYAIFPQMPGVVNVSNTWQWTDGSGNVAALDPGSNQISTSSGWSNPGSVNQFATAIGATFDPSTNPNATQSVVGFNSIATAMGAPVYTPTSAAPPASGELTPSELQINFTAPSGGSLVVKNAGSLIFGSQIQGNGAALVSAADIQLIGTSSDLSSTPGNSMGLNLYAQKNILINSFKLDSAGTADFHGVKLQGVVYSWGNVTINVGDSSVPDSVWGTVKLVGTLVAYGGNPGSAVPGYVGATSGGQVNISAGQADIEFDPAYLTGLYQSVPSPAPIQISAWHER